jgi:hypothetical protein
LRRGIVSPSRTAAPAVRAAPAGGTGPRRRAAAPEGISPSPPAAGAASPRGGSLGAQAPSQPSAAWSPPGAGRGALCRAPRPAGDLPARRPASRRPLRLAFEPGLPDDQPFGTPFSPRASATRPSCTQDTISCRAAPRRCGLPTTAACASRCRTCPKTAASPKARPRAASWSTWRTASPRGRCARTVVTAGGGRLPPGRRGAAGERVAAGGSPRALASPRAPARPQLAAPPKKSAREARRWRPRRRRRSCEHPSPVSPSRRSNPYNVFIGVAGANGAKAGAYAPRSSSGRASEAGPPS